MTFRCDGCATNFQTPIALRSHTCCRKAVQAQADALFQKAHTAQRDGEHAEARVGYVECLALDSDHADAHINLGSILFNQCGDARGALPHFEAAARLKPLWATPVINLAILWHDQFHDPTRALSYIERALELSPNTAFTHHLKGKVLHALRDPLQATSCFATAERLSNAAAEAGGTLATVVAQPLHLYCGNAAVLQPRWAALPRGHTHTWGDSLQMVALSTSPVVFKVENFLNDNECASIIETVQQAGNVKTSATFAGQAYRKSNSYFVAFEKYDIFAAIRRRLSQLTLLPIHTIDQSESVQVVHYTAGDYCGMHHDSTAGMRRYLTVLFYLNDVEEGGETCFPEAKDANGKPIGKDGLKIPPTKGDAVLFYSHLPSGQVDEAALHESKKVTKGEKWLANQWVNILETPDS